jgi:ATP-dependent Clp protease ATP-binding subunit ClpC
MNGYNFTEGVRRALACAREESARLQHPYVGTEHLLLGLTRRESDTTAAKVLKRLNVDTDAIRRDVEETIKRGKDPVSLERDLPYTSRAKKVLELAMEEARELGHSYVGTEHLLLGVLREQKGIGAVVLTHSGITLDALRTELQRLLASGDRVETLGPAPGLVPTPRPALKLRRALAPLAFLSFAFGTVWAAAGAMKLIFGIAISFPLLPPFGLENINAARSLAIGVILFAIGAVLRRKVR